MWNDMTMSNWQIWVKYSFNTLYISCNKCGLQIYSKYKKLKTAALLDTVEFVPVGTVVCYI